MINAETYEPPRRLDSHTVSFWSEHYKLAEDSKSKQSKAKNFIENGCITYDEEEKCWICKPILGYNKTIHYMKYNKELINFKDGTPGEFECTCQGYQRNGEFCSHVLALYLFLRMHDYNEMKRKEEMLQE